MTSITILDLPNEMLCLVLAELEMKDKIVALQTCSVLFSLTIKEVSTYLRMRRFYEHNFIDFHFALHVSQRFPNIPLSVKIVTRKEESYFSVLKEENRIRVGRTYYRYKEYENLGITDAFYDETDPNSKWYDYYDDPGWDTETIEICTYKNNKMHSYYDQPALVAYEYNHHPRCSLNDFCLVEEKWYKGDEPYRKIVYNYDGSVYKNWYNEI